MWWCQPNHEHVSYYAEPGAALGVLKEILDMVTSVRDLPNFRNSAWADLDYSCFSSIEAPKLALHFVAPFGRLEAAEEAPAWWRSAGVFCARPA